MLSTSILSYQGPLSFSTIDALLSEFKIAAQEHDLSFRTYKKMLSIMIEALENITRYGENNSHCPTCSISHDDEAIILETSNAVRTSDIEGLRSKIDHVNKQDSNTLKALYRSTITNGEFSARGGAGLGFIEMARTTGNKLEYRFEDLSPEFSRYTFRAVMNL